MASTSDEQPVSANVTADVQSPPSDNDSGERPVRQQLKETSIESKPQPANDSNGGRKRSFDESREDDDDSPTDNGENRKKRSRESTPEDTDKDKTSSGEANASAKTGNVSKNKPQEPQDKAEPPLQSKDWICRQCKAPESIYCDASTQTEDSVEQALSESPIWHWDWSPEESKLSAELPRSPSALDISVYGSLPSGQTRYMPPVELLTRSHSGALRNDSFDTDEWCYRKDYGDEKNGDIEKEEQAYFQSTTGTSPLESSSPHHESSRSSSKSSSNKRTREEFEADSSKASEATDQVTETPEPEKKRPRDSSKEPETQSKNGFAGSAFAKAVGASPFDSLGNAAKSAGDSAEKTTASAFASSSLAGFAGSEKSPFGSLGATTPSVFKPAASSGFGSLGSGFSGVGGGFSAAAKSGGLRSFASNTAPTLGSTAATQPAETQDAEADETETSENPEKENASTFKAEKTDDRFYAQEMSTGEEDEENIFTCKAKLFNFTDGEWRERGIGTFKVNVRKENGRRRGRMIMRADGALRVMLNSPIFEGMKYGDQEGNAPSTKQLFIASMDEGKIVSCLLRTGKAEIATELYEKIHDLLADEDEGEREGEEDGEEDGK